jgi:hypothetical protein
VSPETYDVPADLHVFVMEGWPTVAAIGDEHDTDYKIHRTDFQPTVTFGRVVVPRAFEMMVMPKTMSVSKEPQAGDWAASLMYEAAEDGSGVTLTAVISSPIEIDEALAELRARHPLTWWKRLALTRIAFDAFDHILEQYDPPLAEEELEARTAFLANNVRAALQAPLVKRRNRITPSHLTEVVRIYRDAVEAGKPPTQTVSEKMHVSHSAASKYVRKAREEGLLAKTTRGKASREAGGRGRA